MKLPGPTEWFFGNHVSIWKTVGVMRKLQIPIEKRKEYVKNTYGCLMRRLGAPNTLYGLLVDCLGKKGLDRDEMLEKIDDRYGDTSRITGYEEMEIDLWEQGLT